MTRRARIIRWFRTKRSLVGQLDDFEAIVAKQIDEIAGLRADAQTTAEATESRIGFLQRSINGLRRSTQAEYRLRTEAEDKLSLGVDELKALHEEIRRAELADAIVEETETKRRLDV